MKIFQIIQRHYVALGVSSANHSTQKYRFNERVHFGFLSFACVILSQLVYICDGASGFMEYVICICSTSGTALIFISFATIVCRKTTLFECIDNIEKTIDASELIFYLMPIWMKFPPKIEPNWRPIQGANIRNRRNYSRKAIVRSKDWVNSFSYSWWK